MLLSARLFRTGTLVLAIAFAAVLSVPSSASAAPPDNGAPKAQHRHGHHHRMTKRQRAKMRHFMKHHRHHQRGGHGGQDGRGPNGDGVHAPRHGKRPNANQN